MTEMAPFAARLAGLLERRGLPADLAVAGEDPDPALLRRLAPELGLHTADLFVFAGRMLPDDLAPCRLTSPFHVGTLLYWCGAYAMPASALAELRRFIAALPDQRVPRAARRPHERRETGPGTTLRRLLASRNIPLKLNVMMPVGDGPYVSTSTYAMVLGGGRPLTAEYVNAFARVLGIALDDLTTLLGLPPMEETAWSRPYERPPGLAELAWEARRLTDEQLRQAMGRADELTGRT